MDKWHEKSGATRRAAATHALFSWRHAHRAKKNGTARKSILMATRRKKLNENAKTLKYVLTAKPGTSKLTWFY